MKIALVAHDNRKRDLIEWASHNAKVLTEHQLIGTGTTITQVRHALEYEIGIGGMPKGLPIEPKKLKSGPLGGDQELGAKIANDKIDMLIFFWDPMAAQPHDPDIKALLRLSVLYNIPTACNRSTADFLISSPLFSDRSYHRIVKDYSEYINRKT